MVRRLVRDILLLSSSLIFWEAEAAIGVCSFNKDLASSGRETPLDAEDVDRSLASVELNGFRALLAVDTEWVEVGLELVIPEEDSSIGGLLSFCDIFAKVRRTSV